MPYRHLSWSTSANRPHALRVFTLITWSTRNLGLWVAFVFCSFLTSVNTVNCVLFHVSHVYWGSGQFESMKRRHTSIDLTWSSLHFHTQALASGLQTGDQASRCKSSWNILICSQLTTSKLKRCPFSGIRLSIRGLQCTCFFLPKYCPGGTKIFQYFTWRVFKSIFSRRMVQSALQVGSYEGNHGNQTDTKCCKSTSTDTLELCQVIQAEQDMISKTQDCRPSTCEEG